MKLLGERQGGWRAGSRRRSDGVLLHVLLPKKWKPHDNGVAAGEGGRIVSPPRRVHSNRFHFLELSGSTELLPAVAR